MRQTWHCSCQFDITKWSDNAKDLIKTDAVVYPLCISIRWSYMDQSNCFRDVFLRNVRITDSHFLTVIVFIDART